MRFAYPRLRRRLENRRVGLNAIATAGFVYMLQGLLMFVLAIVPMFYFGGLKKRHAHCVKLIRVNRLQRDEVATRKQCDGLNVDELMRIAASQP